jgi:hypothetical protein
MIRNSDGNTIQWGKDQYNPEPLDKRSEVRSTKRHILLYHSLLSGNSAKSGSQFTGSDMVAGAVSILKVVFPNSHSWSLFFQLLR